jgi:hypothetical protein
MVWHLDGEAIEGMPLKLMIIALVMAITVPLIFAALRSFDASRVENELVAEINDFIATVQTIYTSGPGNSAVIDFEATGGSFADVEKVIFGDALGGQMRSVVRYQLRNGMETPIVAESPNVPMSTENNTALEIGAGNYQIKAECNVASVDINGDGIARDLCVFLSITRAS